MPASLPFDSVQAYQPHQKTFTIRNTGTAVLNVTGITAPDGFTVVPSASFTVSENDSRVMLKEMNL